MVPSTIHNSWPQWLTGGGEECSRSRRGGCLVSVLRPCFDDDLTILNHQKQLFIQQTWCFFWDYMGYSWLIRNSSGNKRDIDGNLLQQYVIRHVFFLQRHQTWLGNPSVFYGHWNGTKKSNNGIFSVPCLIGGQSTKLDNWDDFLCGKSMTWWFW